ncbi:MAG: lipoate--protein ligase [Eubacterium sp.]|nr:lipoate--protein ligase [Eubacterium sp.]
MIYLETNSVNPCYNLAFEEYVLYHCKEDNYLILWQNDNTIVVGQNQNTEEEVNRTFVNERKIHVVRRATGGGAVYHDLGNLNYSFITDYKQSDRITKERFMMPIIRALSNLGLAAEASGRNDILVNGKKISGTAQRIAGDRLLHHGTLLFDSDLSMISSALNVKADKYRSKGLKSVRSRVGNIRDSLRQDMDIRSFWSYLEETLAGSGYVKREMSPEELKAIKDLKQKKYDTWEWIYGKSPAFNFSNSGRFPGGSLEVRIDIRKGIIQEIQFFGDFLGRIPLDPVVHALAGCPYEQTKVRETLSVYSLEPFFGTIHLDDIERVIFDL